MYELMAGLMLVPLELTWVVFDGEPVVPTRSNGIAAQLVGGIFGLVVIVLAMILLTRPRRPK
jgi:hypothetical protein